MKKDLKNKVNILTLVLITILVLYISLKDNFGEVVKGFTKLNIFWIIIALIFTIGYYFLRSLSLYNCASKFKKNVSFKEIMRMVYITQFFDGITPSSSGGQPYQIYAFNKQNIKIADATNITIQNFIVYQIALVLLGLIAVISNSFLNLFEQVGFIKNLIIIGFIINCLVIVGLFSLAFLKKVNKIVLTLIIKLLSKLKIIKNKDEIIDNLNNHIETFHKGALTLLKDKKNFIKTIIYNLIALILIYMIPVVLLYGLGDYNSFTQYESIIASAYVMLIG